LADICARSFKLRFELKLSVVQAGDFGFQFGNGSVAGATSWSFRAVRSMRHGSAKTLR
jgi:hypothetical protein